MSKYSSSIFKTLETKLPLFCKKIYKTLKHKIIKCRHILVILYILSVFLKLFYMFLCWSINTVNLYVAIIQRSVNTEYKIL